MLEEWKKHEIQTFLKEEQEINNVEDFLEIKDLLHVGKK